MKKYDLTHARHDPAHCLAPGLFRSLRKGERKRSKLDVVYEFNNGQKRIEFSGPEPLGAEDLRVLQGLIAMAGPSGLILTPEPKTESGKQLRLLLEPRWEAVEQNAMLVRCSYRKLAREIGYSNDGGSQFKIIQKSIERLWKVSIIIQNGGKRMGYRLLSNYASNEVNGKLYIALNPRITQAILGNTPYSRISMSEVRSLRGDSARLMHQRLCGWIDPGKSGRVALNTLCSYIWPEEASPATKRKRRQRIYEALPELGTIGWTVDEYARGKFEIVRPPA